MRQAAIGLAVAVLLLGCGTSNGEQVPLTTVQVLIPDSCWLVYRVVDVISDPTFGTVVKGDGSPLRWPSGFTGWRVARRSKSTTAPGRSCSRLAADTEYHRPTMEARTIRTTSSRAVSNHVPTALGGGLL
jgi:hypothetical protein